MSLEKEIITTENQQKKSNKALTIAKKVIDSTVNNTRYFVIKYSKVGGFMTLLLAGQLNAFNFNKSDKIGPDYERSRDTVNPYIMVGFKQVTSIDISKRYESNLINKIIHY